MEIRQCQLVVTSILFARLDLATLNSAIRVDMFEPSNTTPFTIVSNASLIFLTGNLCDLRLYFLAVYVNGLPFSRLFDIL